MQREKVEFCMGIDEAGRGPVLGPMVYACFVCDTEHLDQVLKLRQYKKVNDSKVLDANTRETIFQSIYESIVGSAPLVVSEQEKEEEQDVDVDVMMEKTMHFNDNNISKMHYVVRSISAVEISQEMQKRIKHNLNELSHESAVWLIQQGLDWIERQNKIIKDKQKEPVSTANIEYALTKVFVDTVGKPEKYQSYLESKFPELEIVVSKKADSIYPIVSLASIVAKVVRDYQLECAIQKVKEKYGDTVLLSLDSLKSFGSGYPSDPHTREFMSKNYDEVFGYPNEFIRFSWATTQTAMEKHCVDVEWSDNDSDEEENRKRKKKSKKTKRKPSTNPAQDFFVNFAKPLSKKHKRQSELDFAMKKGKEETSTTQTIKSMNLSEVSFIEDANFNDF